VSIITLLSDFGLKDPYVAEMKAVILSIHPQACIVDISHEIEKFNIQMGAFVLASATSYFPEGTIHVAVVDPGVGTKRRQILVQTKRAFYVGPDNGVLMLAAEKGGIRHVHEITNLQFMLPRISKTFHGRDIFAPAAAHLAKEYKPSDFGAEIHDYVVPKFAKPSIREGEFSGEVLHIDDFGNIITNISNEDIKKTGLQEGCMLRLRLKSRFTKLRFCATYGGVSAKIPLALIGSHEFLEISVNQGNAAKKFGVKVGDGLVVSLNQR